jgi:uncharacterized protein (TIGR03067 family)
MKLRSLLILAAGLLVAADGSKGGAAKPDKEILQGTWKLVALEIDGKQVDVKGLNDARLMVKGNEYCFTLGKGHLEMTFTMDQGQQPKVIDLAIAAGPNKGKTYRGIYTLEGDTFKICRHTKPDQERPTEFATRADSGLMVVVWSRANP